MTFDRNNLSPSQQRNIASIYAEHANDPAKAKGIATKLLDKWERAERRRKLADCARENPVAYRAKLAREAGRLQDARIDAELVRKQHTGSYAQSVIQEARLKAQQRAVSNS